MPKSHRSNLNDVEGTLENSIPSPEENPYQKVERSRNYQDLSNETKYVISIVLNTPKEFFHLMTTETGLITKHSVKHFIATRWPTFIVNYVMKELKIWVSNF